MAGLRNPILLTCSLCFLPRAAPVQDREPAPPKLRELADSISFSRPLRHPPAIGRKLGRVDLPATLKALQDLKVKAYDFLVWQGPDDWKDCQAFLPMAARAKIQIWISIVPPTMGGNSFPYLGDYLRWAKEITELGKLHANLAAMRLVDIDYGRNPRILYPEMLIEMKKELHAAGLHLLGGIYDMTKRFVTRYRDTLDGVVLHYTNQTSIYNLAGFLEGARGIAPGGWKMFVGYYCSKTDWYGRDPDPIHLYYCLRRATAQTDGFFLADLDLSAGPSGYTKLFLTVRNYISDVAAGVPPRRPR